MMRALSNLYRQARAFSGASEHRKWLDLPRWLVRRPLIGVGIGASEMAETFSNRVDYRLKLLAQSKVASMVGCDFCLDISSSLAHHAKVPTAQLLDLPRFEDSNAFDEADRLVLRFAALLSKTPAQPVPAQLRQDLIDRFGKAGFVELAAAIAHEHQRTRLYLGLGIRPATFAPSGACLINPEATVGD